MMAETEGYLSSFYKQAFVPMLFKEGKRDIKIKKLANKVSSEAFDFLFDPKKHSAQSRFREPQILDEVTGVKYKEMVIDQIYRRNSVTEEIPGIYDRMYKTQDSRQMA